MNQTEQPHNSHHITKILRSSCHESFFDHRMKNAKITFIVVVIMFGCLSPDCHHWIATDAIAHSLHAGKSTR